MRRPLLKYLSPLLGLVLFTLALFFLNRALGESSYRDIWEHIAGFPPGRLLGALALTAASYAVLTLYDQMALRYLGRHLGRLRVSLASFISYAFSRNIGFSALTGGAIRYRFYSSWGLSAGEVARLIVFAVSCFTLGLLTMGGTVALLSPTTLPDLPHLPLGALQPFGALALVAVGSYLLIALFRRAPLSFRKWNVRLPNPKLAFAQVLTGSADWLLTAGVLYYLLSERAPLSLFQFLSIYLLAQLAVILSHVPGGLGVFESVILLLVPGMEAPDLLGILLAYRGIYFLLPFAAAILLLGTLEALQAGHLFRRAGSLLGRWIAALAPPVLAGAVVVSGVFLLFDGILPPATEVPLRLQRLPLTGLELSTLLAALSGAALLLLARGVQRRLRTSWGLALLLLAGGAFLTFFREGAGAVGIFLAGVAAVLLTARREFYRWGALRDEPFPFGWNALLLIALGAVFSTALFAYRDIPYSGLLWWTFSAGAEAARSLRAGSGAVALILLFFAIRLRRPAPPEPKLPSPDEIDKARVLAEVKTSPEAGLALWSGRPLLFSSSGETFLAAAVGEWSWISLEDLTGPEGERKELAWRFRQGCERQRKFPIFYRVGAKSLPILLEMGLAMEPVGSEARLRLPPAGESGGNLDGGKDLSGPMAGGNWTFRIVFPPETSIAASRLKRSLGKTLRGGGSEALPLAWCEGEKGIAACAWLCLGREGFAAARLEAPGPPEALEFLLKGLLEWGARQGYEWFSLDLLPGPRMKREPLPLLWERVGTAMNPHGHLFPDLDALCRFAEKFRPDYRPRFICFPGEMGVDQVMEELEKTLVRSP